MEIVIKGHSVLIDDEDFEKVSSRKWAMTSGDKYFASYIRFENGVSVYDKLHRLIMGLHYGDPEYVDHINGDVFDNRKSNLRICTTQENVRNSKRRTDNTSGFKGVSFSKKTKKWVAQISFQGKRFNLGYFTTPELAHKRYCDRAKELFGEFARFK